jgi:REP element-mobilizing transposase RayT
MNRGWRKSPIFHDKVDYYRFFDVVQSAYQDFHAEIHAYALMPNHYHLLLRTPEGNLSRIMRHIDGVYTQKFNYHHGFDGALFRGRFHSILVDDESYLLELVRYIHRNAFEAKLELSIGQTVWSSHYFYQNLNLKPEWLYTENVLSRFHKDEKEAVKQLMQFVKSGEKLDYIKRLYFNRWSAILGDELFVKGLIKKLSKRQIECLEEQKLARNQRIQMCHQLKANVMDLFHLNESCFSPGVRGPLAVWKKALIVIAKQDFQLCYAEISEFIPGISHQAISKLYIAAKSEIEQKRGCYQAYCGVRSQLSTLSDDRVK